MNIPIEIVVLSSAAGSILIWLGLYAWARTRDPLHPAIWLSMLFFLGMVVEPFLCLMHPDIETLFPEFDGVGMGLAIQYLGMGCFFIGLFSVRGPRVRTDNVGVAIDARLNTLQKRQLLRLAWLLGCMAVAAYMLTIVNGGGFLRAYSRSKGGGVSLSGYQGEGVLLGVAAMVLYAMGMQGRRMSVSRALPMLVFVWPLLMSGTFGGRRGPLFLAISSLFFCWHLARGRLPRAKTIAITGLMCVVAVLFIQSQRRNLYLGSEKGFDLQLFLNVVQKDELHTGDNFVASTGAVLGHLATGEHHYGRRFFITYLVRPIPKQFWPTKYDDMARILYGGKSYADAVSAAENGAWSDDLDWRPPAGYAVNSIVDLFAEFSWAFVAACWLFGRMIASLWTNFRERGGFWLVYYVAAMVLSIYLPTQSFSAFAHRFLYICVMTFFISKLVVRFHSGQSGKRLERRYPRQAPVPAGGH